MKASWEREHPPLENEPVKPYIYAADAAEEEPITYQRGVVLHAAMVKQQPSGDILGRLKTLTEVESAEKSYCLF